MMPDFARGWEKDGWEPAVCPGLLMRKASSMYDGDCITVDMRGVMRIGADREGYEYKVAYDYGDPQTAKAKAEQLMEGFR